MNVDPAPSLTRADQRHVLHDAVGPQGAVEKLGQAHLATFRPGEGTLLVGFDRLDGLRARPGGLPFTTHLARMQGWATLDILAEGRTWFRDEAIFDFFDQRGDSGFFDDYDRVVFAGFGMGGYGAGAFSVASPGATVLLVQPCATLARDVVPWERRFRGSWPLSFGPRYGNAARMTDAAARVYVVTDPFETADAMQASLFAGDHVTRLPAPFAGTEIGARLIRLGLLDRLIADAASGELTAAGFARLWRARREDTDWQAALLRRVDRLDRPLLTALAAGHMLHRGTATTAVRRRLNAALAALADRGRTAPDGLAPEPVRAARFAGR